MSQAAVEKILGKLVTDDAFRERFFADPAGASFHAGLELSDAEVEVLARLPQTALVQFSRRLDDRLRRLYLDPDQEVASGSAHDVETGAPTANTRRMSGNGPRAWTQGVG